MFVFSIIYFTVGLTLLFRYRDNKLGDDTTSRDSDSLIQEFASIPTTGLYTCCCQHPKVRENWRTVLAAVTLLVIGVVLAVMGILSVANPQNGSRGIVFLLAGKFSLLFLSKCLLQWIDLTVLFFGISMLPLRILVVYKLALCVF